MAKIKAPNRGFNGLGPAGIMFVNGEAESDDPAALAYFRKAGYEVSGSTKGVVYPTAATTEAPEGSWEPPIPAEVKVGTPLRDAAVDPIPGLDFLPPTNAGKADPHGPSVVSPGLHDVRPPALVPGPVAVDDPAAQQAVETAVAEAVLAGDATADEIPAIASAARADEPETKPRSRKPSGPKSAKG